MCNKLEKKAKAINIKSNNNLDYKKELAEMCATAISIDNDKARESKNIFIKKRLTDALKNAPQNNLNDLINYKLALINDCFNSMRDAYEKGNTSLYESEYEFLNVLGLNITGDAAKLCDATRISKEDITASNDKIQELCKSKNALIENFELYFNKIKTSQGNGEKYYMAINELNALIMFSYFYM